MLQWDLAQFLGWHFDELHIIEAGLFDQLTQYGLDLFALLGPGGGEQGNRNLICTVRPQIKYIYYNPTKLNTKILILPN